MLSLAAAFRRLASLVTKAIGQYITIVSLALALSMLSFALGSRRRLRSPRRRRRLHSPRLRLHRVVANGAVTAAEAVHQDIAAAVR